MLEIFYYSSNFATYPYHPRITLKFHETTLTDLLLQNIESGTPITWSFRASALLLTINHFDIVGGQRMSLCTPGFLYHRLIACTCIFFCCWFSQQLHSMLPSKDVFYFIRGRSFHLLPRSSYSTLSTLPEVLCCSSRQVSFHLLKFMFYPFHVCRSAP